MAVFNIYDSINCSEIGNIICDYLLNDNEGECPNSYNCNECMLEIGKKLLEYNKNN